jgi:GDPmannose 4,6-dehydratase
MWLMLQNDVPDDYVIATGEAHSVHEFVAAAFAYAGLDYEEYVKIDSQLHRPAEVELLLGDPSKARRALDWSCKTKFKDLVAEMVEADLRMLSRSSRGRFPPLRALAGGADREAVARRIPV